MELEADLAGLLDVSHDVAELHNDITEEWTKLADRAKELFGGSWYGTAADSYAEPWTQCCEGVGHVLSGLSIMGQLLTSAAQKYGDVDAANANVLDGSPTDVSFKL